MTTTNNEPLGGAPIYTEAQAIDAWACVRKNNHSIPDDALDSMKAVLLAALSQQAGAAGASEVKTWQERTSIPMPEPHEMLFSMRQIHAAKDAEIADLRAQLARQQAPVGDTLDEDSKFIDLMTAWANEGPGEDALAAFDAIVAYITAWKDAQLASARKDAEQWRFLRDLKCNSLYLTRDEGHATNYVTSKEWIEQHCPEDFADDDPAQVQSMKDTNTIWRLQVYPNTPIGFFAWHGATPDAALDAARAHLTNTTEN